MWRESKRRYDIDNNREQWVILRMTAIITTTNYTYTLSFFKRHFRKFNKILSVVHLKLYVYFCTKFKSQMICNKTRFSFETNRFSDFKRDFYKKFNVWVSYNPLKLHSRTLKQIFAQISIGNHVFIRNHKERTELIRPVSVEIRLLN